MRRILIVLILLLLLPISVSAHGGKTDSDGGHTDHSTGEYHYHHGYPAHDHKDMDGDGIKDCPYEFDDNTDHSPGSSGNNGIQYPGIIVTPSTKPPTTKPSATTAPPTTSSLDPQKGNSSPNRKITFSLIWDLFTDALVWIFISLFLWPLLFVLVLLPFGRIMSKRIEDRLLVIGMAVIIVIISGIYIANLLGYLPFDPIFS